MKYLKLALCLAICVLACPSLYAEVWRELKGEHFLVYFNGSEAVAKEISRKAETYYVNIALGLGYPRYDKFWLWENRVKVYIYPDHASFIKATGQPNWSHGGADYNKKEISSYISSSEFVDSILPHEMAHLIFRDFVGFTGEVPLWLDEGVAQWAEESHRDRMRKLAKSIYQNDSILTLKDMMRLDIMHVNDKTRIYILSTRTKKGELGALLLSSDALVNTFYIQAVSLVTFMIERYGSENFAEFCRQLRSGKSLDEALSFAYPVSIRDTQELENRWREYLAEGG